MGKFVVKLLVHIVLITGMLYLLSNATMGIAILTAIGVALITYLGVDLLMLRKWNNAVATLSDAILTFLMLWAVRESTVWSLSYTDMLIVTVVVAVFEYFYHMWLLRDYGTARKQRA